MENYVVYVNFWQ